MKGFNIFETWILKEWETRCSRSNIWRDNGCKLCKYGKKYKITDLRNNIKNNKLINNTVSCQEPARTEKENKAM